jgi:hypothetical protein
MWIRIREGRTASKYKREKKKNLLVKIEQNPGPRSGFNEYQHCLLCILLLNTRTLCNKKKRKKCYWHDECESSPGTDGDESQLARLPVREGGSGHAAVQQLPHRLVRPAAYNNKKLKISRQSSRIAYGTLFRRMKNTALKGRW